MTVRRIISILCDLMFLYNCRESCSFSLWCHARKEFPCVLWWEARRQLVRWVIKVYTSFHIPLKIWYYCILCRLIVCFWIVSLIAIFLVPRISNFRIFSFFSSKLGLHHSFGHLFANGLTWLYMINSLIKVWSTEYVPGIT